MRRTLLTGGAIVAGAVLSGIGPAMCSMQRNRLPMSGGAPTVRPPGTAKPLLDENIAPVLARLDKWYAAHLRPDKYVFNPPASEARIDAFQTLTGFALPRAYRQLYRWHDGEKDDRWGHFYGLPLLPLDRVADELKSWRRVLLGLGGNRYVIPGSGWPAGAVDPAYINLRWLPLTADGSGNHIGLDFDPWPGGRVGQVIAFGRDEEVKFVIAESLGGFLEWIADLLEGGNHRLGLRPGEAALREFRLKRPSVNGLSEGARIILGAPGQFL